MCQSINQSIFNKNLSQACVKTYHENLIMSDVTPF